MRKKSYHSAGGFTLVEIMIVVAIIALLASMAVPAFMRARIRSLATASIETCRIVDSAKDQWAIENHAKSTDTPTTAQLVPYVKPGSKLAQELAGAGPLDGLGTAIVLGNVETAPKLATTSVTEFNKAIPAGKQVGFYGAYATIAP